MVNIRSNKIDLEEMNNSINYFLWLKFNKIIGEKMYILQIICTRHIINIIIA